MAQNSKVGKKYSKNRPSNIILPRSKSLSVQSIKTWKDALTLAGLQEGSNRLPLLQVYESILIDGHLQSILESRILKILGSKFKIVDANGKEDKDLNILFKKKWFYNFLKESMWSRFMGTTVLELWDLNEEMELMHVGLVPRENVNYKSGLILKEVGDEKGYPYKEGNLFPYYIQIGEDGDLGKLAKIAPDPLTKKFAKAAWLEFVERYSIPPRTITTDSHNDTRHQELADMLQNMISNHWAVLQGGEKLEMMNMQGVDAYNTFDKLMARMNSEMSKGVLGQDGTTDSKDTKGTFGSLQILKEVADDRHIDDKTFIEFLINDELLCRLELISPVYSKLKDHRFEWDDTKELSPQELMNLVNSITNSGYVVDPEYISEKTAIPIIGRTEPQAPQEPEGEKKKTKLSADHRAEVINLYPTTPEVITAGADPLKNTMLSWARDIYYTDSAPKIHWDLVNKTATHLFEAVKNKEETKASAGFEDGFFANLQSNLFVFSASKIFTEYAEISALLVDEKGKTRPFNTFKTEVEKLHSEYNIRYLKTEYNNALLTAQAAGKWSKFESQKDLFDLQYNTAGDSKVRKDHKRLNRITRPVDDAFWNKYYPPIDWACRCTVRQVAKGTPITPDEKLKGIPKVPKPFQFNAGKQQLIFSNDHPYIKNLSSNTTRELQGVKDYGLRSAQEIYARGKNLLIPLKKLDSIEAATKWFESKAVKGEITMKSKIGAKTYVTKLSKKQFDHIVKDNKNSRWTWVHNIPKMLNGAHEIYVLNYKEKKGSKTFKSYRFITYFKDKIRVVNTDKDFNVKTSYEVEMKNAASERVGFLLYAKK